MQNMSNKACKLLYADPWAHDNVTCLRACWRVGVQTHLVTYMKCWCADAYYAQTHIVATTVVAIADDTVTCTIVVINHRVGPTDTNHRRNHLASMSGLQAPK